MLSVVSVFLRWDGEDFVPFNVTKDSIDDLKQTVLFIDETTRTIVFRMGNEVSAFDKRIISRRFQSISKSGININNVQLGIGYTVIEHMGELNLTSLVKDPEKGIASLGDTGVSLTPEFSSKPFSAERVYDASETLSGHNKEALELGLKVLKHVENNRMVIVDTDKSIRVYTKFL